MNKYMDINRIEFTITTNCTSRCRHCSVGESKSTEHIDTEKAVAVVKQLSELYNIKSVMTFGGEPLLYPDTVCAIHKAAKDCNIAKRQIITNGFFSKDEAKIIEVAHKLRDSGVNLVLLSVDSFHREFIPLAKVYPFAKAVCECKSIDTVLHPAWVVNREHSNEYNTDTEQCLEYFAGLNLPISQGNDIFPAGNAEVHLSKFFNKGQFDLDSKCGEGYSQPLDNIKCLSICPNGDVVVCFGVIGNIYNDSIHSIIEGYDPTKIPASSAIIKGGVRELIKYASSLGINVDTSNHYSACGVCKALCKEISELKQS